MDFRSKVIFMFMVALVGFGVIFVPVNAQGGDCHSNIITNFIHLHAVLDCLDDAATSQEYELLCQNELGSSATSLSCNSFAEREYLHIVAQVRVAGAGSDITTHMNITSDDGSTTLGATNNPPYTLYGEELGASSALIGDTFNTVKMYLKKNNSPTGTAYVGIWDSTANPPTSANVKCLINTIDVSTISTSKTEYTFVKSSGTCSGVSGDVIGIFYNGGSTSNNLTVYQDSTNSFDSTNSYLTRRHTSWSDFTTVDYRMVVYNNETGTLSPGLRFNADSGSNYAWKYSVDSAVPTSGTSASAIAPSGSLSGGVRAIVIIDLYNNLAGDRKVLNCEMSYILDSGATVAPFMSDCSGLWANVSNRVTSVSFIRLSGTNEYDTDTRITVWGYD